PRPSRSAPFRARRPPALSPASDRSSPQLEGGESHHGAEDPQDVEPCHHGALMPAEFFEMMMERRHSKHLVCVGVFLPSRPLEPLVDAGLKNYRNRFRHEDPADQKQQELRLEQNRYRAEG